MNKFSYWLPRILSILFILFISMFALDVFEEPMWFWALLIHLIPSYLLTIITIIAWKNERLGGIIFVIFSILLAIFIHNPIISLPSLIIGILFLSSIQTNKLRTS